MQPSRLSTNDSYAEALASAMEHYASSCDELRPVKERVTQKRQLLQELQQQNQQEAVDIADLEASLATCPAL